MARKLYPLGIQTFERIRKEDKLYIDKTEYIYRMTHSDSKYCFLGRPRRFGKSLLNTDLYLVELKLNRSAQAAMQQINLRNYRQRFALSGLPITKVGINFDSTTGNIEDWVIEQ